VHALNQIYRLLCSNNRQTLVSKKGNNKEIIAEKTYDIDEPFGHTYYSRPTVNLAKHFRNKVDRLTPICYKFGWSNAARAVTIPPKAMSLVNTRGSLNKEDNVGN
jgi:hypothetical protein